MKSLTTILLAIVTVGICRVQAQERIVTAGSAITETVCALGDCDKIIAADRTSLYPEQIQQLPLIGYRGGINAEGILSLNPTMVIAEKNYVDQVVLQQLAGTPVKLIVVDRKLNFDDTRKYIQQIAHVLHREEEGKKLIAKIENDLAEVNLLLERRTSTPTVLCIYNRGTATISVGGKDTFAAILPYAGGKNALNDVEGYKALNTEALIKANPDYLLMISSGFESLGGIDGALKVPGVSLTTAGKKRQVISIESLKLTNFGPRFGEAVKELALRLHPELAAK